MRNLQMKAFLFIVNGYFLTAFEHFSVEEIFFMASSPFICLLPRYFENYCDGSF